MNVLFSIAQSPTIPNIFFRVASWVLWLCFFLVVCAFKEEVKKAKKPGRETLPYQIDPKEPVSPSGFLDIEALRREWRVKGASDYTRFGQCN